MKDMFNLQLFADSISPMHQTTTSGLTPEMKEFYSKDLIELASAQLIHSQFGDKTSIPKNGGRTIEWRKFSKFPKALKALTEGVTPSPVTLSVSKISQTLNEFGAWSAVSDILDMTAIDDVIVEITNRHADSMGLTLDTIVRNEIVAGCTQFVYPEASEGVKATSASQITSSMILTPKLVAEAVTVLKKQNAPKIDGSYVCIVHPSVVFDMITSDEWIDVQKYAGSTAIFEGEIGKIYGVRFVETTEALVRADGASSGNVYYCMFLGKGAYKVIDVGGAGAEVIVKAKGSAGSADPLDQRSTIGWKIPMFGAKVTIPEYLVCVPVGSSLNASDTIPANDTVTKNMVKDYITTGANKGNVTYTQAD